MIIFYPINKNQSFQVEVIGGEKARKVYVLNQNYAFSNNLFYFLFFIFQLNQKNDEKECLSYQSVKE